jgi:class 3 adenylate cyclase
MFTRVMKARNISVDVSVLFADLRGYTALSQTLAPEVVSTLLDSFYDECAAAIWEYDGLLNKTIGDAVMAIFGFPIRQDDHPARAVLAARQIQSRCGALRQQPMSDADRHLGVGIGIDCGNTRFGEFGRAHRDLTAVGTVVNTAARAQAVAEAGTILFTEAVHERGASAIVESKPEEYTLKGFECPVRLYTIR